MFVAALRKATDSLETLILQEKDFIHIVPYLKEVLWSCLGEEDKSQDPIKLNLEEGSMAMPNRHIQTLLRETKFIDSVAWALMAPSSCGITGEMQHTPQLAGLLYVNKLLYKLLTVGFLGSRRNEGYVTIRIAEPYAAPYKMTSPPAGSHVKMIEHIISQVGDEVGAEDCLRSLVSNNLELLESRVDRCTLAKFVQLIADKGPKEIFMDFMTALCSCEGKQVISNQEDLLRIFVTPHREDGCFSQPHFKQNRRELIIETMLDYDAHRKSFVSLSDQAWLKANPGKKLDRGNFLGKDIWANGLPQLMISWYSHPQWRTKMPQLFHSPAKLGLESHNVKTSNSFSSYIRALDGTQLKTVEAVKLAQIAWVLEPDRLAHLPECAGRPWLAVKESLKDKQALNKFEYCLQLAQYYQSQLELFAEMCLDRSYNCIESLERMFTFDMLIVGMADEALPLSMRSTFTTLCQRLYIDRFPHSEVQVPRLVRVWTEVDKQVDLNEATLLPQVAE